MSQPDSIPNVLAERYATPAMRALWSGEGKVRLERDYWIAVLKGQRDLGIPVPEGVIEAYEKVKDQVNLTSIMERERITRHDVKARIEEFCDLAGHEHIHKGMTSRDLTENVEQLQTFRALLEVRKKSIAVLAGLARRAQQVRDIPFTARTHNVAAQVSTLGKRLAMFGQELLLAFTRLDDHIERYPVRGLKGAVGTQLDQLTLLGGDTDKVDQLESRILKHLGFKAKFNAVGQVYPRSLDFDTVSALHQVGAAAASCAACSRTAPSSCRATTASPSAPRCSAARSSCRTSGRWRRAGPPTWACAPSAWSRAAPAPTAPGTTAAPC